MRAPPPSPTTLRTYVFADLRDYTSFVEGAGDRAAADLIREYRSLIRGHLGAHEGAEVKTEGDSFYIVFSSPSSAIGFGVEVFRSAGEAGDRRVRFGIGIHAGESVPLEGQFVGSAVNVAARVGALAGEGELLITDTVRGLVRTSLPFRLTDHGPVALKGVAEPVRLYAVDWRAADAPAAAILPPVVSTPGTPLVGRTQELARLGEISEALASGRGGAVLVGGPAGIGKTRLLREWATHHPRQLTLVGASSGVEAGLYEPFVEMLRVFAGAPEGQARLRRIAPELLVLLPELGPVERPRQIDRETLFGAFLRLGRELARQLPLVLVADDLHWADEGTLALFRFLATEARSVPLVLAGTYRDDELVRGHPLRALLAAATRWGDSTMVTLGPLSSRDAEALLARVNPDDVREAARGDVIALAEGNPLFLEELARSASDPSDRLPLSIAESVLRRVNLLEETTRRVVVYAAVSGARVDEQLLQRLLDLPERELLRHLRAAVEAAILVETIDGIAFTHALTREAIYRDLMRREQRLLHREIAEVLIALHGDDAAWAAEIERHLLAAGKPEAARPYALAAGQRAVEMLAPDAAIAHFDHAVEAARTPLERAIALEALGDAYRRALNVGKAVATLRDAAALFAEHGTKKDVARSQAAYASALPYGRDEQAAWLLAWERAREAELPPADLARIAQSLADRAFQYMDDDDAKRWLATARELAKGAPGLVASIERTALEIEREPGWHQREERDLAARLDKALERDEAVVLAYRRYLDARARDADSDERAALLRRARTYVAQNAPNLTRALSVQHGIPWMSWLTGDWNAILRLWEEMKARFAGDDLAEIYPDTGPLAAAVRVEREGPDVAGPQLRALTERQERSGTWRARVAARSHLANVRLVGGEASAVAAEMRAMFEERTPASLDVANFLLASRAVACAALLSGDGSCTGPWLAAAPAIEGDGRGFAIALMRLRGVAAATRGEIGEARRELEQARAGFAFFGWDHLAAECAWQLAALGDKNAAADGARFYQERGALWRVRWIEEERWR